MWEWLHLDRSEPIYCQYSAPFTTAIYPITGGSYRSCLLGDETFLYPGVMRATGDKGHMDEGGRLVYDGRCDRQIKRLGHRINMDHIQQVCSMCEGEREVEVLNDAFPLLY